MSTPTTNYGLIKAAEGEQYDVDVTNNNLDAIDTKLKQLDTEVKNDRKQIFGRATFSWAAQAAWDAGALNVEADPAAQSHASVPTPTFCTVGTTSGSLKFLEPGMYDVDWYVIPQGDPGHAGYKIVQVGGGQASWPGNPSGPHAALGQAQRHNGAQWWETYVSALNIRVPIANLEIRLTGVQQLATNNSAIVRVTQTAKF
jgi:hypothetical protein